VAQAGSQPLADPSGVDTRRSRPRGRLLLQHPPIELVAAEPEALNRGDRPPPVDLDQCRWADFGSAFCFRTVRYFPIVAAQWEEIG
jgi:hypothetical protein